MLPVRLADLEAALLDGDGHRPEVIAALDDDGDGEVSGAELVLEDEADVGLVRRLLEAQGVADPRISAEVRSHEIHHGVANGEWAIRECSTCHGDDSVIGAGVVLTTTLPGGVMPEPLAGAGGGHVALDDGVLWFDPSATTSGVYVFGSDRLVWVDVVGALAFAMVLAGITAHGVARWRAARLAGRAAVAIRRVYMYSVYERLWHWVQTAVILILLLTGLAIHAPGAFGIFAFDWVVGVHNVMAAVLIANAALAVFYHVASGEIRQYLPRPQGFFERAAAQAVYYLKGIFAGEAHPFAKDARRKLNPLQQVTYFGILNVLLPLQIATGVLIWGAQRWPGVVEWFGGLPVIAPVHALVAWLFGSFVVLHVYLTTTGHTPMSSIKAMMSGWDEVHGEHQEVASA